jgi:predicted RNase H-like HicB family nuclease
MVTATEVQTLEFRIVRQAKTDPPLTFTVEITYDPEDKGYLVECVELDVATWGDDWDEAVENLLDAVLGVSEVLVCDHRADKTLRDPRLPHAQLVVSLGGEEALKKLLGL